jgi:hypothetical protein
MIAGMAPKNQPLYPDTTDILQRKAEGRRELAALSFGEKIRRLEALRERLEPIKLAREKNRISRARP